MAGQRSFTDEAVQFSVRANFLHRVIGGRFIDQSETLRLDIEIIAQLVQPTWNAFWKDLRPPAGLPYRVQNILCILKHPIRRVP